LTFITLIAAVALAALHLVSAGLRFLDSVPRSRWLSVAGGTSVAYVFVHLLPDLAEGQEEIRAAAGEAFAFIENHAYLVALVGLAVFYGLERLAKRSRRQSRQERSEDATGPGVFWLHAGLFAVYNALIGYLLVHREEPGGAELFLYTVAMGLHFVVNDRGLAENHKALYSSFGRPLLAGAVLLGWAVGFATEISDAALSALFAFLGGGVILNVLKEELPEERESRFWAFALGAALYTAVLLIAL
jgi:hypothetical protein